MDNVHRGHRRPLAALSSREVVVTITYTAGGNKQSFVADV